MLRLNDPIATPTPSSEPPRGPVTKSGVAASRIPAAVKYARSESVSATNAGVSNRTETLSAMASKVRRPGCHVIGYALLPPGPGWQVGHQYVARSWLAWRDSCSAPAPSPPGPCIATLIGVPHRRQGCRSRR